MPYYEENDPYWSFCTYESLGSAFDADFTCTRKSGHLGSHYDENRDRYEPNA